MKNNLSEEKTQLGERGELETPPFLKNLGLSSQRADLISYPFLYKKDLEICGEVVKSDEAIRVEVKSRSRLWNPTPYWAVMIEEAALVKYGKFDDKVEMRTLIVAVVLVNRDDPKSSIGGYFIQWLHRLLKVPKGRFFYELGRDGRLMKNIHIDEFESYYIRDELKLEIMKRIQ